MKTNKVTTRDLQASVLAVPPLARNQDLTLNEAENRKLIKHIEHGGVSTLMYGGNANLYHIPVSVYEQTLAFLAEAADADTWVIPSFGPDYGRLYDQAAILERMDFPTAMALPLVFPGTTNGIVAGINEAVQRFGKPIILYIKQDGYLPVSAVSRLKEAGAICAVKYAVVRDNPAEDAYLSELIAEMGTDIIISGIGEVPVIEHFRKFGLRSFTSGSVCVAPNASMAILNALNNSDFDTAARIREAFMALEELRNTISPMRVLHDAISLSAIADMGPMLPMLDNLSAAERERVQQPAQDLLGFTRELATR